MKKKLVLLLILTACLSGCGDKETVDLQSWSADTVSAASGTVASDTDPLKKSDIPAYAGTSFVTVNDDETDFTDSQKMTLDAYSVYGENASFAQACIACPVEESGLEEAEENSLIEHTLISSRLCGDTENPNNSIRITGALNNVMEELELKTAAYINQTGNHVLYRVEPVFSEGDVLCRGVYIEAYSIEDKGSLSFCVFGYNNAPELTIDYKTGTAERGGNNE